MLPPNVLLDPMPAVSHARSFSQFGMMGPISTQHGFARNVAFEVVDKEPWKVVMVRGWTHADKAGWWDVRFTRSGKQALTSLAHGGGMLTVGQPPCCC
jgi:hypothetical protein